MHPGLRGLLLASIAALAASTATAAPEIVRPVPVSRANTPPRKVVVSTAVADFSGPLEARLALARRLVDEAASVASRLPAGRGLDLMVFPEFAIGRDSSPVAGERAVELGGSVEEALGAAARAHRTWLVVPMTLREPGAPPRFSNAAVLFDRTGRVAGIFRKVHPIADARDVFEGGVTPGEDYPAFPCDFGRLGILICWDMSYDEAWAALAGGGAELVALPSASPQNLRPAAQALRHRFYVVNSAPRDNASVFDPIGRTVAQRTEPGVLVQEIDLAYAILHWSEDLHEGRALADRFGAKVGYDYSTREDTGVFWSNDPGQSIGSMIRQLGLREMPAMIEDMEAARRRAARTGTR